MAKQFTALSILVFIFISCSDDKKKDSEEAGEPTTKEVNEKVATVKALLIEEKDFNYELISNGTIGALNRVDLKFQNQEIIEKIYVKNGSWVTKGQVIAQLDTYKLKSSLATAEDAKERALLELQDVLIGQGYSLKDSANIPPQTMKIAKIRSNYDQSVNNYDMAKYNLDMAKLKAPFSGVIANLWAKEHNVPGGDIFCTILDNNTPEVFFSVLENEISLININDKVIVAPFSSPEHTVEGRVTEINPLVDKNGMIRLKAVIANKENKLYEGMNVKVRVQRLLGKRIVVPKTALVLRTNRKVIFTLKNNRAMWNYVETAQENTDSYVVVEGVNAGDSVIYDGNINLAHDAIVKLMP